MKNRLDKPVVTNYQNVHVYLADLIYWFRAKKTSLRSLAKRLNISPALLSLVVKGKRKMTEENVDIWAPIFGWNSQEVAWLKNLIILDHADTPQKLKAMSDLTRFKAFQEHASNEVLTFKYLKKWWNVAIRELSELSEFKEDEYWIQERLQFKVSAIDIRKALIFLNKHKLLAKYGDFRTLDCQGNIYKLSLSDFHKQILERAVESIYLVGSENRHILGHTMAMPKSRLPELKLILDNTLKEIMKLSTPLSTDAEIFHVELLAIPLSSKKEIK